jgi:hypothetical protein
VEHPPHEPLEIEPVVQAGVPEREPSAEQALLRSSQEALPA